MGCITVLAGKPCGDAEDVRRLSAGAGQLFAFIMLMKRSNR